MSQRMRYKIGMTEYTTTIPNDINEKVINKRIKLTSSQTWTTPYTGWYKFILMGGGGGGYGGWIVFSSKRSRGGSGGGQGGTSFAYEFLSAGDAVVVTIGAGGTGGLGFVGTSSSTTYLGNVGGNTSILVNGKTYTACGAGRKLDGTSTDSVYGGEGDIYGFTGGSGCEEVGTSGVYGGDGQSGAGYGGGFGGRGTSAAGGAAYFYGGGGGGGNAGIPDNSTYTPGKGGNGYQGVVWVEYFDPTL